MKGNRLLRFLLAAILIAVNGCDAPEDPPVSRPKGDAKAVEVVSTDGGTAIAGTGHKWAVIVGVNLYLDGSIPSLKYAVADAELVADTLVEKCGYDKDRILLLSDDQPEHLKPLKMNLDDKLPRFLAKAAPGDTVFVFFSGHGFPDSEGQTYLAPKNCRRDSLALSGLRVDEISNWLRRCKAKRKLLVLDCCHAGGKDVEAVGCSSAELSKPFRNATGLITLASCKLNQKSFEWEEKRHGLFTYFLVEGLSGAADKDGNSIVDSDEIYHYVYDKVPVQAELMADDQTPVRHIPPDTEGVFELARLVRPPLGEGTSPAVPGDFTLTFTVRANNKNGKPLADATVEVLYSTGSNSPEATIGRGTSDGSGTCKIKLSGFWSATEGGFVAKVRKAVCSKRFFDIRLA